MPHRRYQPYFSLSLPETLAPRRSSSRLSPRLTRLQGFERFPKAAARRCAARPPLPGRCGALLADFPHRKVRAASCAMRQRCIHSGQRHARGAVLSIRPACWADIVAQVPALAPQSCEGRSGGSRRPAGDVAAHSRTSRSARSPLRTYVVPDGRKAATPESGWTPIRTSANTTRGACAGRRLFPRKVAASLVLSLQYALDKQARMLAKSSVLLALAAAATAAPAPASPQLAVRDTSDKPAALPDSHWKEARLTADGFNSDKLDQRVREGQGRCRRFDL